MIDFYEKTVKRLHPTTPDDWRMSKLDCSREACPDGYVRITGAIPGGVYKSGPRKGRIKWTGKTAQASHFLAFADVDQTKTLYEAETGNCSRCLGTGKLFGRDCSGCGGSGKAAVKA